MIWLSKFGRAPFSSFFAGLNFEKLPTISFCLVDKNALGLLIKASMQLSSLSWSIRSYGLKNTESHFKQNTYSWPFAPFVSLTCYFKLWINPLVALQLIEGHYKRVPSLFWTLNSIRGFETIFRLFSGELLLIDSDYING